MPSEIVHCVLCDRRNRAARSKFAKLHVATSERQEKIYDGYKKRNSYSLNHSLMNKTIHISCYNTFTFGLEPVTTVNKTGPGLARIIQYWGVVLKFLGGCY